MNSSAGKTPQDTGKHHFPYNLIRSFFYALRGCFYALTRERNLRIHFTVGAFTLYITRFYALSNVEFALILLCIGFVVVCEMINTAIEKAIDLEAPTYHYLAGISKDVAAGAVLISAATSVAVGFLLLWDIPTIKRIWYHIILHPLPWGIAVAAAIGWIALPLKGRRG